MQPLLLLAILAFALLPNVELKRNFFNGRRNGGNVLPPPPNENVKAKADFLWFEQTLDHFNPTEDRTFQQRYLTSEDYFNAEKRNVAYLFLGGEGPISSGWMSQGTWIATAAETGALLFQLEHRYYGESQPFGDVSTENLRYLTSVQALADTATFIDAMNRKYNLSPDVKWIAYGGSYSGAMAAWLRLKYPHLVHGSVASSGPILAQLDFENYLKVVADDLTLTSQECVDAVQEGTNQLSKLTENRIVTAELKRVLNLCAEEGAVLSELDNANLFETISGDFSQVAQYNNIISLNLDDVCKIMTDKSIGSELERLAAVNVLVSGDSCVDVDYNEMIEFYRNSSLQSEAAIGSMRQWLFQTCNEFGYYQTSSHKPQIFGNAFPVETSVQMCTDLYGSQYNETFLNKAVDQSNIFYGGLNIKVTNVIFVYGSIDPWHALGILETTNADSPVIFINGTAHCADMYDNSIGDPEELVSATTAIKKQVLSWLS